MLTPIIGKPTNTTLQILQRQLFPNARSVPSTSGGGTHGHLAVLLSPADYLLRAGVPFVVPVHPGPPSEPVGTAAVIGVALRNHAEALAALADLALYNNLNASLTAQILSAVNASFLSALEDPDFGFRDVSPRTMLEHLRTEYGTLTPEELEKNHAALSEPWKFDDPAIEDLWAKIVNIQRVAAFGAVPIADITIITLILATMIEKTGLLATTTENFRLRPITEWTVATFKTDFILGNKERIRRLTAGDAGFHGAHNAISTTTSTPTPPALAAAAVTPTPAPPAAARHVTVEGGKMYYCWTHGLSPQRNHTSITCLNKAEGHRDDATAFRMRGNNNTISSG